MKITIAGFDHLDMDEIGFVLKKFSEDIDDDKNDEFAYNKNNYSD